jgi:dipeptidyl-peptidase 4
MGPDTVDTLPRRYAQTKGFTLGTPHSFRIAPDGARVVFLRSRTGRDPSTCLCAVDLPGGVERLIADPASRASGGEDPPEERLRRERLRQPGAGVTAFACDRALRLAAFALSGRLWVADLDIGEARELAATGPVVAPRPDPTGTHIAYVAGGSLRVLGADGSGDRELVASEGTAVTYGLPEFAAAESMGRQRGFWWSPAGTRLLVSRVDTTPVPRRYLADPGDPAARPVEIRYPAAGEPNADVSLWILDLAGGRIPVEWDRRAFEYVVAADWGAELLVVAQSRDHRTVRVLAVDPRTGRTRVRREETDGCWVRVTPGTPAQLAGGALVWVADLGGARRLVIDDDVVTPGTLNVREVLAVDGDTVLFSASVEPTEIDLWTYSAGEARPLTTESGVHYGQQSGGTTVVVSESMDTGSPRVSVRRGGTEVATIASHAETPDVIPKVTFLKAGAGEIRTALLLPHWHEPGQPLPVLLDPYGGPGKQRVLAARREYVVSQWFADQGFAVVVADGRGTPGRGPSWDRAIHGDKGSLPLADQIEALHAAREHCPDLDLDRVGIRGWSFSGYLAALAVLRRPDVFHAAVAGAPPTDQRLYNSYWTERYLGHPAKNPEAYHRSSLLEEAEKLQRPLLLIHGLADDNVLVAHTLRLSAALTAAGRPHTVLPLSGETHGAMRGPAAERLLVLQRDFLLDALAGGRT